MLCEGGNLSAEPGLSGRKCRSTDHIALLTALSRNIAVSVLGLCKDDELAIPCVDELPASFKLCDSRLTNIYSQDSHNWQLDDRCMAPTCVV